MNIQNQIKIIRAMDEAEKEHGPIVTLDEIAKYMEIGQYQSLGNGVYYNWLVSEIKQMVALGILEDNSLPGNYRPLLFSVNRKKIAKLEGAEHFWYSVARIEPKDDDRNQVAATANRTAAALERARIDFRWGMMEGGQYLFMVRDEKDRPSLLLVLAVTASQVALESRHNPINGSMTSNRNYKMILAAKVSPSEEDGGIEGAEMIARRAAAIYLTDHYSDKPLEFIVSRDDAGALLFWFSNMKDGIPSDWLASNLIQTFSHTIDRVSRHINNQLGHDAIEVQEAEYLGPEPDEVKIAFTITHMDGSEIVIASKIEEALDYAIGTYGRSKLIGIRSSYSDELRGKNPKDVS